MKKIVKLKLLTYVLMGILIGPLFIDAATVLAITLEGKSELQEEHSQEDIVDIELEEEKTEEEDIIDESTIEEEVKNEESSSTILKKEQEIMESLIESEGFDIEPAVGQVANVTSEFELTSALSNHDITHIVISSSFTISNIIQINRDISIAGNTSSAPGRISLNGTGSFNVTSGVSLKIEWSQLGGSLSIDANTSTASSIITINDRATVATQVREGSFGPIGTGLIIQGLRDGQTGIELKNSGSLIPNNGTLENNGYIRISGVTNSSSSIGIKLNGGTFNEFPDSDLEGFINTGNAIVSESGNNLHSFSYTRPFGRGGNTRFTSGIGVPVYQNNHGASLTVNGEVQQLAMWELTSDVTNNFGETPDFATGEFQFSVTQIGHEVPTINSINNHEYRYLFNRGILPWIRSFRSAAADELLPPMKLPEGINVDPIQSVIPIEGTTQLTATLIPDPSELDNDIVHWFSSDETVATVNQSGEVFGIQPGETMITAETVNGLQANARIIVEEFTFSFSGSEGNSTATVTGYLGSKTDIEIPSEAINYQAGWAQSSPVVTVGNFAFRQNNLTNVKLPEGILTIGIESFRGNQLTTMIFPSTLTSIGVQSFQDNQLTRIDIPDSVQIIEHGAFSANNIAEVTFGNGIEELGATLFHGSPLTSIVVSEEKLEDYRYLLGNLTIPAPTSYPIAFVTERTILRVTNDRYSDDTLLSYELTANETLELSVLPRERYQLMDLNSFSWNSAQPTISWTKNEAVINGATHTDFIINHVQESDSGSYSVSIENRILPTIEVMVSPSLDPEIPPIDPTDPNPIDPETPNPNEGALTLRFVSDLDFGTTSITNKNQTVFSRPSIDLNEQEFPNMVTVQDMRSDNERDGWRLTVRQVTPIPNGSLIYMSPYIHDDNKDYFNVFVTGTMMLNTSAREFAGTDSNPDHNHPSGILSLGMHAPNAEGVRMEVPGQIGVGEFQTILEWNLISGP